MKTVLTKGLSKEQEQELRSDFKASVYFRKRMIEILKEKQLVSYKESCGKDSYQTANWAYLQADARGYERALNEVISILSEEV